MPGRKAQIAIEYLTITGVILAVAVTVFTYSYVSNTQSIRVNQANNAVERITNIADLVYALGPGNSQFVEVTFPQGIELIQDITLCQGAGGTYQNHYGEPEASCLVGDEVKGGAVEMRLNLIGGPASIKSSSKAEIEMDVILPEETVQPTMGKHIIKVYWCGNKICISSTEYAATEECLNGTTRDCPLKNADCLANPATCTCTEALETCIGGVWPGCEKETYQDYNSSYEQVETSCNDEIDNDCDSLIDCDDRACDTALVCRCNDGETRLCILQDGVCAESIETCTDRDWPGCDSGSYGEDYENWETSCDDKLDNDCDNLTDCLDSDCVDSPACGYEERTVIYVTTAEADNADFASLDPLGFGYARRGADQVCIDLAPANLPEGCTDIHALLSIASPNNEIEDLPRNYGYDPDEAIYWWHSTDGTYSQLESDWAGMLNGTIDREQSVGTGIAEDVYSGSYADGTLYSLHCENWSNASGGQSGSIGCSATDSSWLECGLVSCSIGRRLRCAARCLQELNCTNGEDDDSDGKTDCADSDCATDPVCGATESKTTIFISTNTYTGNLGGRAEADSKCQTDYPANLPGNCSNTKAFISVSATDEIRDMNTEVGGPYDGTQPVYWWHSTNGTFTLLANDWTDMLDESIEIEQYAATGIATLTWSGSNSDGTIHTYACTEWTSATGGTSGSNGKDNDRIYWLSGGSSACSSNLALRCITECQAEADCSNDIDDDADGQTDCDDSDCATNPACTSVGAKTTIFISTNTYTGDLGNRAGADNLCQTDYPANLPGNCSNTKAFISVSATDEIRDMNSEVGGIYDGTEPVYWWHSTNGTFTLLANDWTDMLDGWILVTEQTGTGSSGAGSWTGSDRYGGILADNCTNWTTQGGGASGRWGTADSTSSTWLDGATATCPNLMTLRCITECETEADCTNTVDDDSDGLTDCEDDDCAEEEICLSTTVIYMSANNYDGAFGGRAGADTICQTDRPGNLPASCTNETAFLSVNEGDQIAGMPPSYGYNPYGPINWWHNTDKNIIKFADNWADMLDSSIEVTQEDGTGIYTRTWTGSNANGTVGTDTCIEWTDGRNSINGIKGNEDSVSVDWLNADYSMQCNDPLPLRCVARCLPETSCSDSINDNGDATTDCADLLCRGQTGPSGETCEAPREQTCDDGWDNDGDGQTDCDDTEDCSRAPNCSPMLLKTMVYVSNIGTTGARGGRVGANSFCTTNTPSNFPTAQCSNVKAFLSVSATDEIQDMISTYPQNDPVYWWNDVNQEYIQFADNWNDMLDGSIDVSQGIGTGRSGETWSGSYTDGSVWGTCNIWTDGTAASTGVSGTGSSTTTIWLEYRTAAACTWNFELRCIAECQTENNCTNSTDDDSDTFTDCDDPDCAADPVCICENDTTRPCEEQDGVCAGSFETCTASRWPGCDSGDYGVNYEAVELTCDDLLDNDCQGGTDCADTGCYGHSVCCNNGTQDGDETGTDCGGSCTSGTETGNCTGGVDDDKDCLTDCDDPDCSADPGCTGGTNYTDRSCNVDGSASTFSVECGLGEVNMNEDITDATFDFCEDGTNDDFMHIEDIFVDATTVLTTDTVQVTCEVNCYSIDTEYAILYNSGSGWTNLEFENCDGAGIESKPINVDIDDVAGTHYFRCWESWTSCDASNMCCSSTYADNDDISIEVIEATDYTDRTCNIDGSAGSDSIDCGITANKNEGVSDATFDLCADGSNNDWMHIEDISVDATTVLTTDTVQVTCDVCCYSDTTKYAIAYNSGSGWTNIGFGQCGSGSGIQTCTAIEPKTVNVPIDDIVGTHYFRCIERFATAFTGDETCDEGTYSDNDDMSIEVIGSGGAGIPTDYISWWKFEGNANDETGTNDGTLIGNALITNDAERGQVVSLDGDDDYVDLGTGDRLRYTEGTISAWVNFNSATGQAIVAVKEGTDTYDWSALRILSGKLQYYIRQPGGTYLIIAETTDTFNTNEWHHVVYTSNSSGNWFYVNNVLRPVTYSSGNATTNAFFGHVAAGQQSTIGTIYPYNSAPANDFSGSIDDVMIYDRALTEAEIQTIYDLQS